MILDAVLDVIGALLESVTDWQPGPRWRVNRAVRLSRRRSLSVKRRQFAITWLTFGLDNLAALRMESRAPALRAALERVQQVPSDQR